MYIGSVNNIDISTIACVDGAINPNFPLSYLYDRNPAITTKSTDQTMTIRFKASNANYVYFANINAHEYSLKITETLNHSDEAVNNVLVDIAHNTSFVTDTVEQIMCATEPDIRNRAIFYSLSEAYEMYYKEIEIELTLSTYPHTTDSWTAGQYVNEGKKIIHPTNSNFFLTAIKAGQTSEVEPIWNNSLNVPKKQVPDNNIVWESTENVVSVGYAMSGALIEFGATLYDVTDEPFDMTIVERKQSGSPRIVTGNIKKDKLYRILATKDQWEKLYRYLIDTNGKFKLFVPTKSTTILYADSYVRYGYPLITQLRYKPKTTKDEYQLKVMEV